MAAYQVGEILMTFYNPPLSTQKLIFSLDLFLSSFIWYVQAKLETAASTGGRQGYREKRIDIAAKNYK